MIIRIVVGLVFPFAVFGCSCNDEPRMNPDSDAATHDASPEAAVACTPDLSRCKPGDSKVPQLCTTDMQWQDQAACGDNSVCISGECVAPCEGVDGEQSNLGCEFWPATIPGNRYTDIHEYSFGVYLTNPNAEEVSIEITRKATSLVQEETLAAQESKFVILDWEEAFARSRTSSFHVGGAYRVRADRPIVAYQVVSTSGNLPDDTIGDAAAEVALMLPTPALGERYTILTYPGHIFTEQIRYGGTASIVATAEGTTMVTIDARDDFTAGTQDGAEVNAIAANTTQVFEMLQGDALHLVGEAPGDVTGTVISSTAPVAVYTGNYSARIPVDKDSTSDMIFEQQPPDRSWGKAFVVSSVGTIPSRVRIVAQTDNTQLSFPNDITAEQPVLLSGEVFEMAVPDDSVFTVNATEPILVGQFTVSETDGTEDSSPSFVVITPVEQYQDTLSFFTPDSHPTSFVHLYGTMASAPQVDGESLPTSAFSVVSGSEFGVWRWKILPGQHTVLAADPVGTVIFGKESFLTYAYPAGGNLRTIVVR